MVGVVVAAIAPGVGVAVVVAVTVAPGVVAAFTAFKAALALPEGALAMAAYSIISGKLQQACIEKLTW